jgi:O-antigen ligase
MNQKKLRYLFLFIMLELVFYLGAYYNSFFSYVGLLLIMLFSVIMTIEDSFYLLLFLLPNRRLIVLPLINISLLNIIIFISLFKLIRRNNFKIPIFIVNILMVLYFFIISRSFFTFKISLLDFLLISRYMILILFIILYSKYANKNSNYKNYIYFFVSGTVMLFILELLIDYKTLFSFNGRLFVNSIYNNPNFIGNNLSFAISILLVILLKNKKFKIKNIIIVFILIIFGLATQSRAFILSFIFSIFYVIFFGLLYKNKFIKKNSIYLFLTSILGLLVLFSFDFFREFIFLALDRIFNPRGGDISNGRFELWKEYIKVMIDNLNYLFLGVGSNSYKKLGIENVAHNAYIEMVVNYGIIGFSIIIYVFNWFWKRLARVLLYNGHESIKYIGYLPLLIIIINSIPGHNIMHMGFVLQLYLSVNTLLSFKKVS